MLASAALVCVATGCSSPEKRKLAFLARGDSLMSAHQYQDALLEFRSALAIDPDDAASNVRAGGAAEQLGNYADAVRFYRAAIDAGQGDIAARGRLGRLLVLAGAPDQALELVETTLQTSPDDALLLSVRASARLQKGDLAAARADAERAIRADPACEDGAVILAGILRREGRLAEAATVVENAIQAAPRSVDLRLVLAQLQLDLNRPHAAAGHIRAVVRAEPGQLEHTYRLARLLLQMNDVDGAEAALRRYIAEYPDRAEARLALADLLATQRGSEVADAYVATLRTERPRDTALQLGIGNHLLARGRTAAAEAVFRGVARDRDAGADRLRALNRLAAIELGRGRTTEAAASIREVLERNPNDADALMLRAELAIGRGDAVAAVADLRTVLRDQPASTPVQRALARAHLAAGDATLAEEALRAAVAGHPDDVPARVELAELLIGRGDAQAARTLVEGLVQDDPGNVFALALLYRLHTTAGELEAALATAARISTLRPDQSLGYYLAGLAQWQRHDRAAAARSFEAAIAATPTDWRPYLGLAQLQLELPRPEAALTTFERGVEATNHSLALVTELATLYESRGRIDDAIAQYEQLLAVQPANLVAANNLAMLIATHRRDPAGLARAAELAERLKGESNPALQDTYGWLLHLRGQHREALATLSRAVTADPATAVFRYHLGMVQRKLGQLETARSNLQQAVAGDQRYAGRDEALATLEQPGCRGAAERASGRPLRLDCRACEFPPHTSQPT